MASATASIADICAAARRAARTLAALPSAVRDGALKAIAAAIVENGDMILDANGRDLEAGADNGLSDALMDRLALDERRLQEMARGVCQIAALPDPVGEVLDGHVLPNGLWMRRVRVPLGVIAVVYEARPNVTIDAAALCLKSGNAVVLRGSSAALHSNAALSAVAIRVATEAGLPAGALAFLAGGDRAELTELATQSDSVDLIIPRGGEGLKAALKGVATVPVMFAASGNNHIYVDQSADLEMARAIVHNAKLQRPGVCNAAETLLVHSSIAETFLPSVLGELDDAGVALHGDPRAIAAAPDVEIAAAIPEDWDTEYLALEMAVAVVDSLQDAIDHIGAHGSGHSEAIVTSDAGAARSFGLGVDAACVYVNASTRFTDGGEFGMGAEIGNSTQKLHARGPIGVRELCTFKYLIEGNGQIRG
jgi:glutamate-5-semialdehyde dehydrogenase